jgi:hypothetical protein
VFRIDFAAEAVTGFDEWRAGRWQTWGKEQWRQQGPETEYTPEGYQYWLTGPQGGYYLEPGNGQFPFNRGDNATVYVTRHQSDEGDADMVTIGPCCNTDYRQGPEVFIGDAPDAIVDTDLVLWYVPRLENDDTPGKEYCWADMRVRDGIYRPQAWPCYAGPLFIPKVPGHSMDRANGAGR